MPGKVKVKVLAGRNLPVMDRGSDTTDAYVEIKIGTVTHKTDVCRKSLNPQWNTDWYRFEVDDAELQDEPLQIRLMDYDTYSANDAIGKVYISLHPLLLSPAPVLDSHAIPITHSGKGGVMSGWIPVFDTMHGIRGEVNVIVKVELFSDVNKFRQSSCGVHFFHSPIIPHGYHAQVIHGFVDELVVNDDPEYQWIDKIRTPRASNEARQVVFLKLSGQVQRKIGLKALDLGANAVIGYTQCFDLEGDVGVVARGVGTAVTLIKLHESVSHQNNSTHDPAQAEEHALKYLDFLTADKRITNKPLHELFGSLNSSRENSFRSKIKHNKLNKHNAFTNRHKSKKQRKKSAMILHRHKVIPHKIILPDLEIEYLEKEELNLGEAFGDKLSKRFITSKNIIKRKMNALKAKLSDGNINKGNGPDSSLTSSYSDVSIQSDRKNSSFNQKAYNKSKMSALLSSPVKKVHSSLQSITEAHANRSHSSPNTSRVCDSKIADSSTRSASRLNETNTQHYDDSNRNLLKDAVDSDSSSTSDSSSSERDVSEISKIDDVSMIVKAVLAQEQNQSVEELPKDLPDPVLSIPSFNFDITSTGNKSFSVPSSPVDDIKDMAGKKSEHKFQRLLHRVGLSLHTAPITDKRFHFDLHKKRPSEAGLLQVKPDIGNRRRSFQFGFSSHTKNKPELKHSDGLIGTAMQTILMDKINIMSEILDEDLHGGKVNKPREIKFESSDTHVRDTVLGAPFLSIADLTAIGNLNLSSFSSMSCLKEDTVTTKPPVLRQRSFSLFDTAMETILIDKVNAIMATPHSTPPREKSPADENITNKLLESLPNALQKLNTDIYDNNVCKFVEYDPPNLNVPFSCSLTQDKYLDKPGSLKDEFLNNTVVPTSLTLHEENLFHSLQAPTLREELNSNNLPSFNDFKHDFPNTRKVEKVSKSEHSNPSFRAESNTNAGLARTNACPLHDVPLCSSVCSSSSPVHPGRHAQSSPLKHGLNINTSHRRSSDSDLSITPKASSIERQGIRVHTGLLRPSMHQDNIDLLEYPFLTIAKYPAGFIQHLGGTVAARSVKLLERVPNPDEPETRDTWWTELRMEIRSHARALACNVVLGYNETTTISDDICVLSATGTAAVINLHYNPTTMDVNSENTAPNKTTHGHTNNPNTIHGPKELMTTSLDRPEFDKESKPNKTKEHMSKATHHSHSLEHPDETSPKVSNPAHIAPSACSICHIPYSKASVPFRVKMIKCAVCRRGKVPNLLFCTVEVPERLQVTGRGCLVQAHVLRPKRDLRSEMNAREISDSLPFLEYELHRLLISKLKVKGMNAIFGLKATVAIGERMIAAIATGTAVFLSALPPPCIPTVISGNSWKDLPRLAELQQAMQDTLDTNRDVYQLNPSGAGSEGNPSDTEDSDEELADLDLGAGNKDACIIEVDDQEDLEMLSLLMEPRPPDGFHVVNTQAVPGLQGLEIIRNLQTFVQVWRAKLPHTQANSNFPKHFQRLLQSVYFKLRSMIPCAVCDLRFRLDLPESDELQLLVTGMALGLGEPVKYGPTNKKFIMHSASKDALQRDDDMIFSLEEEQITDVNSGDVPSPMQEKLKNLALLRNKTSGLNLSRHLPVCERYGVDITPLSYVPGGRIDRYLGNLNFFFIRESTSIRENGGISGFVHGFITEILAVVRAHATALGGNAMVAYYMTELILVDNLHKNQGQCIVSVGGDVVFVSYFTDE